MSAPKEFRVKYGGHPVIVRGRGPNWIVVPSLKERPLYPWTAILTSAQVKRVKAHAERHGVTFSATPASPTPATPQRKARPVKKRAGKRSHLFTSTNQPRRRRR